MNHCLYTWYYLGRASLPNDASILRRRVTSPEAWLETLGRAPFSAMGTVDLRWRHPLLMAVICPIASRILRCLDTLALSWFSLPTGLVCLRKQAYRQAFG